MSTVLMRYLHHTVVNISRSTVSVDKQRTAMTEEKVTKRKGIVHINHEFCKRCGICVNFCPVKNLEIQHQTLMELERCIACKMCQRYCPDFAIEIEEIDAKAVITG